MRLQRRVRIGKLWQIRSSLYTTSYPKSHDVYLYLLGLVTTIFVDHLTLQKVLPFSIDLLWGLET